MRYSIYFAWFVAVLSICVLTTLASLPGLTAVERAAESTLVVGVHGSRSIKVQRVRCNVLKPACHAAKQKLQPKAPA
ncbi:MAG TPA: hypothetical protein VM842_03075 [Nitrospira sp.]|jgi:hypothetical protein|nr:hypothetical protein [Nitrospira sp.]